MLTDEVLDVPAFDMTDAALNSVQTTTSGKKAKTPRKRGGRRDGSVGRSTFDAINKMTAEGTITKQAAFIAYGEQTNTPTRNRQRQLLPSWPRPTGQPTTPGPDRPPRRPQLQRHLRPSESSPASGAPNPAPTWTRQYATYSQAWKHYPPPSSTNKPRQLRYDNGSPDSELFSDMEKRSPRPEHGSPRNGARIQPVPADQSLR